MSGFDNRSDLPPPPHYEWSPHDFDSKVATATERSLHQSFSPISGPSHSSNQEDYEAWSDEKFEAAARAYEARQAKRRTQGSSQPGASGSGSGAPLNYASSNGVQRNVCGPPTYPLGRSQTPRPSDYAQPPQPYSRAPTLAPASAPASAPVSGPSIAPPQPPTSPYRPVSPQGDTMSNEDRIIATADRPLQRAVSLFRTPGNDHGEQLPAFTDVALPEEMVPQHIHQSGPTPPPAPRSPPPPHSFSAPSGPPPPPVRVQVGSTSPPPTIPRSPPPPHTFSVSSRPPSSLNIPLPPPPPPPLVSSPLSLSPSTAPASPIYSDPPPAFIPSNRHFPTPEKTTPYAHPQLGNTRVISNSRSVYASANRTTTQPAMRFDPDAAYGRSTSPAPPQQNGMSLYSSAVTSTMAGRQLPKPPGGKPRTTLPPGGDPRPWTMGVGGQPDSYGFPDHTGAYASHHQQPYQPGGFYPQPPGQQPYGQNQPSQQGTPWNNQYPDYGVMTPPPGGHGQPPGGWGVPSPWTGNGGQYRQ